MLGRLAITLNDHRLKLLPGFIHMLDFLDKVVIAFEDASLSSYLGSVGR